MIPLDTGDVVELENPQITLTAVYARMCLEMREQARLVCLNFPALPGLYNLAMLNEVALVVRPRRLLVAVPALRLVTAPMGAVLVERTDWLERFATRALLLLHGEGYTAALICGAGRIRTCVGS